MGLLGFVLGIVGVVAGASIVQKGNVTTTFVESTAVGAAVGIGGYIVGSAIGSDDTSSMFGSFGGGVILGGAGKAIVTSLSS
jgi:hypothetical protein